MFRGLGQGQVICCFQPKISFQFQDQASHDLFCFPSEGTCSYFCHFCSALRFGNVIREGGNTVPRQPHHLPRDTKLLGSRTRCGTQVRLAQSSPLCILLGRVSQPEDHCYPGEKAHLQNGHSKLPLPMRGVPTGGRSEQCCWISTLHSQK